MTTLHLRMTEPVQTRDAVRYPEDSLGAALANLESSIGLLEPGDLSRIKAILQKYVGGSGASTNQVGMTRAGEAGDAADAGRQAAAVVRANIENNVKVAGGYRTFWDAKNRELRESIRR
jgi:hypothetical protein